MAAKYLTDAGSEAELINQVPAIDRPVFDSFEHTRIEAVFDNRIFILYQPGDMEGAAPEILTTVKVLNYACDSSEGSTVEIEDTRTGQRQILTHVPARVFHYDVFMSVPTALRLSWDARPTPAGVVRSLSYALLIKTGNRSDQHSPGATYVETPNIFRRMFPGVEFNLNGR